MDKNTPLANRIRPQTLDGFFGQEELVGKNSFLRKAIETDSVPSLIFWGPPGSGKTTLAAIIAKNTNSEFIELSAVTSGIKDLREIIEVAKQNQKLDKKTIVFIDEIHRWNKAQQDALLPHVEKGVITLIGATTENPSFEVISALISRSRVFVLKSLDKEQIKEILKQALKDKEKGLGKLKIEISDDNLDLIAHLSNGDGRSALNTLEICVNTFTSAKTSVQQKKPIVIDEKIIKQAVQKSHLMYDKNGEEHYNIISALHKSMRGNNPHAALYWLARMLEAGEDPLYIARRLVRFASEDVGLADSFAVVLANNIFDVCKKLGMPECSVHLSHLVVYLAKTKKSVLAYLAYKKAKDDVNNFGNLPVPFHIRNAPTKLMKDLGYGKNYKYTPLEDSSEQEYFPDKIKGRKYF